MKGVEASFSPRGNRSLSQRVFRFLLPSPCFIVLLYSSLAACLLPPTHAPRLIPAECRVPPRKNVCPAITRIMSAPFTKRTIPSREPMLQPVPPASPRSSCSDLNGTASFGFRFDSPPLSSRCSLRRIIEFASRYYRLSLQWHVEGDTIAGNSVSSSLINSRDTGTFVGHSKI